MAAMAELTDAYFCYNSIKASSKYGKAAIFPRLFIIFSIIIHLNTITIFPLSLPNMMVHPEYIIIEANHSSLLPSLYVLIIGQASDLLQVLHHRQFGPHLHP